MPPARTARRAATNENDENINTRVTRAKAAAVGGPPDAIAAKKSLQAKKNIGNVQTTNENAVPRKRTALGDVSNVNKGDAGDLKETKKPLLSKASRAGNTSTRPALGVKDKNTVANDLKRPASVAAGGGHVQKKRVTGSNSSRPSVNEEEGDNSSFTDENVAPAENSSLVKVEITETVKTTTSTTSDGKMIEQEMKREQTKIHNPSKAATDSSLSETIKEMDWEDASDPLMVGEYVYEILDYMKELERATAPNPNYMDNQKELEWRMRGVLVDWLLEVHTRFHLLPETFYLTVNIIDRFLSCKHVHLDRLQLVGVTAMFIASKYEEVLSPHINNFSHVADDGFTEAEILSAERYILASLNYDLSFPNPMHFIRRISKADNYDIQTRTLAKYLLEISLLDHRFLAFPPSVNAAASMFLARKILDKGDWNYILVHYSGYSEEEIRPAFQTMIDYLQGSVKHEAFYKKYAAKKFLKASLHARAWAKRYAGDLSEVADAASP